jgi:hypothetical protein
MHNFNKKNMGRDTDFYIMNKEKVREELYPDIISSDKFTESFKNFIIRRKSICGNDYNTNYENIIKKAKSDINSILPSELFELTYWFGEIEYDYETKGIELLYNLHGTTAYSFMFQYGNFTDYYALDALKEVWSGKSVNPNDFIRFLDYMILLMGKIVISKIDDSEYNLTDSEKEYISKVADSYKDQKLLQEIIDSEFEYLKKEYISYIESDSNSKLSPEVNTIFWARGFLDSCIEMKIKIAESNTKVLIVDSI